MSFIVQQKIKGKIYLYSVESYWDKDAKKVKQKRKYLGPKIEDKKADIAKIESNLVLKNFGSVFLLQFLAEKCGLKNLLEKIFQEDFLQILHLVFFQICQSDPSYLFHYWFDDQYFKQGKNLFSADVSDLFEKIGKCKNERLEFCRQWIELQKPVKIVYYDITSISSYSKNIEWVEWGYNRDKENLPQINLGLIYSQNNHTPLWYNVFAGSIVDVSTIKNSILYSNYFKLKDLLFVLDCGFFSKTNLNELNDTENNFQFIMPISHTTKVAKEIIKKHGKQIASPETAVLFNNQVIHYKKTNVNYDKTNVDVHIFLNQEVRLENETNFLSVILGFELKYKNMIFKTLKEFSEFKNSEVPQKIRMFFKWNKTNMCLEKDMRQIKGELNKSGCFLLATNDMAIDKLEVLKYYRNKDIIEKVFDSVKNEMDTNRLHTHQQLSTEGKLFIKFLSSILYSLIGQTMEEKNLYKSMSIRELLLDMQKIKITVLNNDQKIFTELTKRQKKILDAFGLPHTF
jgi:transposase